MVRIDNDVVVYTQLRHLYRITLYIKASYSNRLHAVFPLTECVPGHFKLKELKLELGDAGIQIFNIHDRFRNGMSEYCSAVKAGNSLLGEMRDGHVTRKHHSPPFLTVPERHLTSFGVVNPLTSAKFDITARILSPHSNSYLNNSSLSNTRKIQ
jgi:hypothetical protein